MGIGLPLDPMQVCLCGCDPDDQSMPISQRLRCYQARPFRAILIDEAVRIQRSEPRTVLAQSSHRDGSSQLLLRFRLLQFQVLNSDWGDALGVSGGTDRQRPNHLYHVWIIFLYG